MTNASRINGLAALFHEHAAFGEYVALRMQDATLIEDGMERWMQMLVHHHGEGRIRAALEV